MWKVNRFILAAVLLFCMKVWALPTYFAPTHLGTVPLTQDGVQQVKTHVFRICNKVRDSDFLALELSIHAGNELGEWSLSPDHYNSQGAACQDFTLTFTPIPEITGEKSITVFINPCHEGFNSCVHTFSVTADVVSEERMKTLKSEGLVLLDRYQYIGSSNDSPQPFAPPDTDELRLIGAEQVSFVDYLPATGGLALRSQEASSFSAGSRLCPGMNNQIVAMPELNPLTLYNNDGNVVHELTGQLTGCIHLTSPDGLLRLVPGSCPRRPGEITGLLEVRERNIDGTLTEWGSVCDDNWNSRNTQIACRIFGAQAGRFCSSGLDGFCSILDSIDYIFGYEDDKNEICCQPCGQSSGVIRLDNVRCNGRESSIFDCPHSTTHDCDHSEDISISCAVTNTQQSLNIAGCPDFQGNILPFITCNTGGGMRNLTRLNYDDFTRGVSTVEQTHFLNIPETALGNLNPLGYFYTRSGHLLMIGSSHSMLLNIETGSGAFSMHQFPIDIKGRLPVVETTRYLYSLDRDLSTRQVSLNRFLNQNNFLRDKRVFEGIPIQNPESMTLLGGDKLLVSGSTDTGMTELALFMQTNSSSVIPGLSDSSATTTNADGTELTSEQPTIASPQSHGSGAIVESGAIVGGFFGGIVLGETIGITIGVLAFIAWTRRHIHIHKTP